MRSGRKILLGILCGILVILVGAAVYVLAAGVPEREKYGEAAASPAAIGAEQKTEPQVGENAGAERESDSLVGEAAGVDRETASREGAAVERKQQSRGEAGASNAGRKQENSGESAAQGTYRISLETAPYSAPETVSDITLEDESGTDSDSCTLLFAGDVYLSSHVLNAYDKAGGIAGVLDEGIRAEIEAADIFMVNQEFPFTERGTPAADKQFTFRLPMDRFHIIKEMGVDIVTLANNHILDYGEEGLLDSCAVLEKEGIPYVGAGENLERAKKLETITVGNRTIGFLGTSRVYMDGSWAAGPNHPGVFSTYDSRQAVAAIKEARELCDYLVVYVHWGVERETTPKEYQRTMGREYIDAGADLVIGSHPHVLQPVEYYNDKPIVYSLGNFVFGSSIPSTELFKVTITEAGVEVTEIPCTSSAGYTRLK